MRYIILFLVGFAIMVLLKLISNRNMRRRQVNKLKGNWGVEKNGYVNFEKVMRYNQTTQSGYQHQLAVQTMNDIDFDALFTFVDRTTSTVGQQYLYDRLKKPKLDRKELKDFDRQVEFFEADADSRILVQSELIKLGSDRGYSVSTLLAGDLPVAPLWFKWLIVDVVSLILSVCLSFEWPLFIIISVFIAAFNVFFINYLNKRLVLQYSNSLTQLNILITVAKNLGNMKLPFEPDQVQNDVRYFRKFQRKIDIIYFGHEQKGQADITQLPLYVFDLFKSVFLIESFALYALLKTIKDQRTKIEKLFQFVGLIDTVISVASLRNGNITTCKPYFIESSKQLFVKNGIHPLIKGCISNTIEVNGHSVLLTGSNMSGKTTFLRMISINALLAQTLFTCFAEEYKAPCFKLYSSIRIDDNLFQGKSYFFQEVNVISTHINAAEHTSQCLFVLDELFKGTNTIERIASAKAILSYLDRENHIVFVSTHDIELINLLDDEYHLYHFAETIEAEKLYFDYQIKPGPLKTRNAIKILKLMNFPDKIVKEAGTLSTNLLEHSRANDLASWLKKRVFNGRYNI